MTGRRWTLAGLMMVGSLASMTNTMLDKNGWARRTQLARDLLTVKTETDALEERVAHLRRAIDALATRRDVQEQVVREELGYVREHDMVLKFGD